MISVFEHFTWKNGALRWSLFVGKQKHNVQWPNSYTSRRSSVLVSHRCRHVTIHHSLQLKILHNICVVKIYIYYKQCKYSWRVQHARNIRAGLLKHIIHRLCHIMCKNCKIFQTTINTWTSRKQKAVTYKSQPRKCWRMRVHNLEHFSHCYVALCTLEVCVSVAIRQHKLSLFLVRVISIGILLLISAKLRGVHGRDLQIYQRHFLSYD